MRAAGVVVVHPFSDGLPCLIETEEQRLVQELVPHLAIEAFDIAVLHGLAGGDVMPIDLVVSTPGEDGMRGEFSSIAPAE